jgi:SAM-dependent methyltransferase
MNDLKETYNKIAKDWHRTHIQDTWWEEGTDMFLSFVKKDGRILDVGCGGGQKSVYMSSKGYSVVSTDLSESMLEVSRSNFPKGEFYVYDILKPAPFKEKFDGIFAQAVLLHISKKEIQHVISNLVSLLNSGGYFYVAVKELKPGQKEDEMMITENDLGYDYTRFFSFYTLPELKGYVEKAGCKIAFEKIISPGKSNWVQLIAQKV